MLTAIRLILQPGNLIGDFHCRADKRCLHRPISDLTASGINVLIWHTLCYSARYMIRISLEQAKHNTIVVIDGRLLEADLDELARVRDSVTGATVLSLHGLEFCVGAGIQALRAWLDAGARLQDATPYLRMMLEDEKR